MDSPFGPVPVPNFGLGSRFYYTEVLELELPWSTDNWSIIKACPFMSQAQLKDRITPQKTKGRSTSSDELCYEMTSQIPSKVQKPRVAALLLVLLLTYYHHSQETWMKPNIFQYSLFHPSWGVSSVYTSRESVKVATLPHHWPLIPPPAIPRNTFSPCLLPSPQKELTQIWIQPVVALISLLVAKSVWPPLLQKLQLRKEFAIWVKTQKELDTFYVPNARFYCLSRYQKH